MTFLADRYLICSFVCSICILKTITTTINKQIFCYCYCCCICHPRASISYMHIFIQINARESSVKMFIFIADDFLLFLSSSFHSNLKFHTCMCVFTLSLFCYFVPCSPYTYSRERNNYLLHNICCYRVSFYFISRNIPKIVFGNLCEFRRFLLKSFSILSIRLFHVCIRCQYQYTRTGTYVNIYVYDCFETENKLLIWKKRIFSLSFGFLFSNT